MFTVISNSEWLQSLAQVLAPDGEDSTITADMFRDAVSTVSRLHTELMEP